MSCRYGRWHLSLSARYFSWVRPSISSPDGLLPVDMGDHSRQFRPVCFLHSVSYSACLSPSRPRRCGTIQRAPLSRSPLKRVRCDRLLSCLPFCQTTPRPNCEGWSETTSSTPRRLNGRSWRREPSHLT